MEIFRQDKNIWVAASKEFSEGKSNEQIKQEIKERLSSCEAWFADLDDHDAKSPGKRLALNAIGTSHLNPKYLLWCIETGFAWLVHNDAESRQWKKYATNFLRSEKALEDVTKSLTDERIAASLYNGVREFYQLLPAMKIYVTRNILQVAKAYAQYLGFHTIMPEAEEKGIIAERFIQEHPNITRYGCGGNSKEDESMSDILHFYQNQGKIKAITLHTGKKPNEAFDISIGKDRSGLVKILKE